MKLLSSQLEEKGNMKATKLRRKINYSERSKDIRDLFDSMSINQ